MTSHSTVPNPSTVRTIYHLAEAAGWDRPRDPDPLPEGAERTPAGGVCIKRTEPEPAQPSPPAPAISPAVLRACRDILTGPDAAPILARIGKRRETWRDKLIQLLAVAESKASWVFDADLRWLGEQLGVSKTAAGKNMIALDAAGVDCAVCGHLAQECCPASVFGQDPHDPPFP